MKKVERPKLIFAVLLLLLLLLGITFVVNSPSALAQKPLEETYPNVPKAVTPTSTKTALPDYVGYIFNLSIMVAGLVAFGSLVYGGFRYLTSAGNPSTMSDAQDQILSAFLGLILLLSSWLILHTINPQLTVINLPGLKKYVITEKTPTPPPPPTKKKNKVTFFQIPVGKIIERAVLDNEAKNNFNQAISISKKLEEKTEKLKDLSGELKTLTDACKCGNSSCNSNGCYGGPPDCPISPSCIPEQSCKAKGCPSAYCNKEAIKNKSEEIKSTIKEIRDTQGSMSLPQSFLTSNSAELRRAAALMSLLPEVIRDYNDMLSLKNFLEDKGKEVDFAYFPGWGDIKVNLKKATVNDPATFYFNKDANQETIDDVNAIFDTPRGYYYAPMSQSDLVTCSNPEKIRGYKNYLPYAKSAAEKTGMRAALLLAVIKQETNWGNYLGGAFTDEICTAPPKKCGTPTWKKDVCDTFVNEICPELELDPYKQKVSSKVIGSVNQCGGAIGPAQFMPFNWIMYQGRIAQVTGHTIPSPYDFEDAFAAAALFLKDRGADSKTCSAEMKALVGYFGARSHYQDCVLNMAKSIADDGNLEHCKK